MNNIKSGSVTLLSKALITQSFVNTSLTVLFLHLTEFYFRDIGCHRLFSRLYYKSQLKDL